MKLLFSWEVIDSAGYGWTERAKVFGGWLVRTLAIQDAYARADGSLANNVAPCLSICFLPDSNHEWEIVTPNVEKNN